MKGTLREGCLVAVRAEGAWKDHERSYLVLLYAILLFHACEYAVFLFLFFLALPSLPDKP